MCKNKERIRNFMLIIFILVYYNGIFARSPPIYHCRSYIFLPILFTRYGYECDLTLSL